MNPEPARWQDRFSNYKKALLKLEEAVIKINNDYPIDDRGTLSQDTFLDDIIKEGVIQRFEYTHELAWKVMKDFLKHRGHTTLFASKDSTREAFATGLIHNGEIWIDMIESRNKTSHTYNEHTADEIFMKIVQHYLAALVQFRDTMETFITNEF